MGNERNRARQQSAAQREAARKRARRNGWLWRGGGTLAIVGFAGWCGYQTLAERRLRDEVATAQYAAGLHVAGVVSYQETPPMGGPHNVIWQNCGIYDAPIHNEHAVHALEHGAVWITYRPDLPAEQVQQLRVRASDDYMLLSPYPGLPAPVVASAWNHQVALDGAADPRLPRFIAMFKNNPATTPEFGASCSGGTALTAAADTLDNAAGAMAR